MIDTNRGVDEQPDDEDTSLVQHTDEEDALTNSITEFSGHGEVEIEKRQPNKSSIGMAFFNFIRGMVGTSFLTLPFLCEEIGPWNFIIVCIFITCAVLYGMILLIEIVDDIGYEGGSYEKIMKIVFKSKTFTATLNVMMASMQLLVSVGGCLFTIELLQYILCANKFEVCHHRRWLSAIALSLSAPTYFIKSMATFSKVSIVSTTCLAVLITGLMVEGCKIYFTRQHIVRGPIKWEKLPSAMSIYTYALEGVGLIIPIKNSMQEQSKFRGLMLGSTWLVSGIYMTNAIISSAALGEQTRTIVLMNYSIGFPFIFVFMVLYSLCIFLTYPINLFPVYTVVLNSSWSRNFLDKSIDENQRTARRKKVLVGARLGSMSIVFGLVMLSPNFMAFLSLVGAIFLSSFGFFLPVLAYNKHFGERQQKSRKIFNILYFCTMASISLVSVVESISNLTAENKHKVA